MYKKKFFQVLNLFGSKRSSCRQPESITQAGKFQTLEIAASQATKGHLNGYKEGANVQRPTHHS